MIFEGAKIDRMVRDINVSDISGKDKWLSFLFSGPDRAVEFSGALQANGIFRPWAIKKYFYLPLDRSYDHEIEVLKNIGDDVRNGRRSNPNERYISFIGAIDLLARMEGRLDRKIIWYELKQWYNKTDPYGILP